MWVVGFKIRGFWDYKVMLFVGFNGDNEDYDQNMVGLLCLLSYGVFINVRYVLDDDVNFNNYYELCLIIGYISNFTYNTFF